MITQVPCLLLIIQLSDRKPSTSFLQAFQDPSHLNFMIHKLRFSSHPYLLLHVILLTRMYQPLLATNFHPSLTPDKALTLYFLSFHRPLVFFFFFFIDHWYDTKGHLLEGFVSIHKLFPNIFHYSWTDCKSSGIKCQGSILQRDQHISPPDHVDNPQPCP